MAGASRSSDDLHPLLKRLLESRGVTAAELGPFLHPSVADLADPCALPGIREAADVILPAVAAGRRIVVFGDYDCDGICATAILTIALRALAADPSRIVPFIPRRLEEGYGMSDAALARLFADTRDVSLVVTVDNGINAVSHVRALREKGVAVVVTDHHLPGAELPPADALVDPKVSAPSDLADLCGAGVAFMLANRLVSEAKRGGLYAGAPLGAPLLVLAGLATVTDIMPVLRQNRVLVAEALRRFPTRAPIGLWELFHRAARNCNDALSSRDFGFVIGPRINAVGRIGSGMTALELILEPDRESARRKAFEIDQYNGQRKEIERRMTEEALTKVVPGASAQVIDLPDGHQGVAGIVAARVLEKLASDPSGSGPVPVCVIARGNGAVGHGSARSPEGVNIHEAFKACASVLERFGGHAAAAGFTVKEGRTDEFRRLLCEICASMRGPVPARGASLPGVEMWLSTTDITLDLAEQLSLLEPFGEGNKEPVFGLRGVRFSEVRPMGAEGQHLQIAFADKSIPRAVWWNHGDLVEKLRATSATHDVAFTLTVSDYGTRHVELRLVGLT